MAPSVSLLYILFTVGFLSKCSTGISQLELGVEFIEEPKDVVGIKGKPLSIPCKTKTSQPKDLLQIKWYHNNRQMDLANDKRRTIFKNGTLYFSKIVHKRAGHSDQGEYRCVAARENGSLSSKPGFLRISALPESYSCNPVEQNVEIGSNVRFFCDIDMAPEMEIEWVRNEHKLPQNVLKYAVISGPEVNGSILYIFNVVPDDSGSYRCTAKNILLKKQRHSSNGTLTVSPQTKGYSSKTITFLSAQPILSSLSFSANVKEIKEGDNVTLDCVVNGYPIPKLVWTFLQHGQTKPKRIFNVTNTGYNIVQIKNITRHQAGWYTCRDINLSKKESTTELKVIAPPVIQEKSESIVFRASKTIRFRCIAYGNPVPDIYWLKDGDLCNITGRIVHRTYVNESQQRLSELILSSSVTSDAGIYQCMANNSVGFVWAASRLLLNATKPAPEAPEKVSCESLSSSQIKISWDVPESDKKIIGFTVHYHLTDNGEEMQKLMPSDSRSTQIEELLPSTNYTFYVRLYMDAASEFSEKTVCQTGEEVSPVEAPDKKIKILNPNSVHVSWSPLPREKTVGVEKDETSPKTAKNMNSDHYIGLMIGLGISICCIISCTTCILCRRRCLKRQVSQEFDATSSRRSNGNDCARDRELVTESRETEYFTFLTSQRERPGVMEVAVQHLDTKGHYPNGSANGIRLSLLSEGRTSNGSSGKTNIYITENPRYDPNCSDSPLLSPRTHSSCSRRDSEALNLSLKGSFRNGKRKLSGSDVSFTSNNKDSMSDSYSVEIKKSPNPSDSNFSVKNAETHFVQNSIEKEKPNHFEDEKLSEDEQWSNINSVLKNPDFRFSDTNSLEKVVKRKNGYMLPKQFCNGSVGVNGFQDHGSENGEDEIHGIYKDSKISLHLVSKEITQES